MRINTSFSEFKKIHSKKKPQILFKSLKCNNYNKVENLYKFLLAEKTVLFLSQLKKGLLEVDILL